MIIHLEAKAKYESHPSPHFKIYDSSISKKPIIVNVEFKKRTGIGTKTDLLAKAIGFKKGAAPKVIDATVGLGRDLSHFLALGCEVIGLEKNELLWRAVSEAIPGVPLELGDASEFLSDPEWIATRWLGEQPDCVYLDPMFPEKKKSAKSGKESMLLQILNPHHDEREQDILLRNAIDSGIKRVVVKRPLHAPSLLPSLKPKIVFKGKAVRYDVYIK